MCGVCRNDSKIKNKNLVKKRSMCESCFYTKVKSTRYTGSFFFHCESKKKSTKSSLKDSCAHAHISYGIKFHKKSVTDSPFLICSRNTERFGNEN